MLNAFPLVSIAIITYNQKEFLRECIESCLRQDYEDFEIVIADDGSSDGTHEMLEEYAERFPNKFVLRLSLINQGITKNSNVAHFACNGKYIAWIGGDDLMLPNKLKHQVAYMENNPNCSISYHDLDVFDSMTNKTLHRFSEKSKPRQGKVDVSIKHGTFNGACSTMVRKDKAPKAGYNEMIPVASDWLYWVETLANGGTINYINEVLGRYRRHSANVTNKQSSMGQVGLDHLNSCNYILSNYPEYFEEVMYRYAINIRSNRYHLPYVKSLIFSLKNNLDPKSFLSLIIYLGTLSKVKL